MNFSLKKLASYCVEHSSKVDKVLIELERETYLKTLSPQMISGPLQGQLLAMVSRMIRPISILEIGTFTGYSTICLAQGLKEDGSITTIEANLELEYISTEYFKKAGIEKSVCQLWGDAKKIIDTLDGPFDMVFIDAGKQDYNFYYDQLIDKVVVNGVIIVDNVLWGGKVTDANKDNDTRIMDSFNKKVKNDSRVEKIMLPIRDGITLIIKK